MPRVVALVVVILALLFAGYLVSRSHDPGRAGIAEPASTPAGSRGAIDPLAGARTGALRDANPDAGAGAADRDATASRSEAERAPRAFGRIVDSAGRPIGGARVRLLARPSGPLSVTTPLDVETRSRDDGSFELSPLPARTPLLAEASAPERVTQQVAIAARESGDHDCGTLALADAITQAARVVSAGDGAPIPGARAWIARDPPAPGQIEIVGPDGTPTRPPDASADADGRMVFDRLDAAFYRFRFAAGGFAPLDLRRSFIAARGGRLADWKIELVKADGLARGRVLGPGDRPIADATVTATATATPEDTAFLPHRVTAKSGTDGTFTLSGLTRSDYSIRATAPDAWQTEDVVLRREEGGEVVLRMVAGASLLGQVRGSGRPARRARIEIRRHDRFDSPMTVRELVTGDDGRFTATDLEPGRYTIAGATDQLSPGVSAPVAIAAGVTTSVELELEHGATITARAVRDGRPIAAVAVLLSSEFSAALPSAEHDVMSPLHGRRSESGPDGRLRLDALPDGAFAVQVAAGDGGARIVRDVTIGGGRSLDLGDVELPAVGAVEGVARDASGAPLENVEVVAASDSAGVRKRTRTDASGRFRFGALPAVDFLFSVTSDSSETRQFFVTETGAVVAPGVVTGVAIVRRRRS